jgi:glycerol-3-phosphate acyltransferase PlsY
MSLEFSQGQLVLVVLSYLGVGVVAFVIGSLNPAATFARLLGKDLRSSGSGNPGATNAGRVLGAGWGVGVLLLDILKGWLPVFAAQRVLGWYAALFAGVCVVLGHMFSPFLRGRGGKGVATTFGVILAAQPWVALGVIVTFAAVFAVVRSVGRTSIIVSVLLAVGGGLNGVFQLVPMPPYFSWWLAVIGILVLHRHRSNIEAWLRSIRPQRLH